MTLDKYIDKLLKVKEQYGGDIDIVETSDNYELHGNIVPVSDYKNIKVKAMKLQQKTFFDYFDGTSYRSDVYISCDENDKNAVNVICI